MHNHMSVICSSTQLLILPFVVIICISYQSQHCEISALPNSLYLSYKAAKLHNDPTIVRVDIEDNPMSRH